MILNLVINLVLSNKIEKLLIDQHIENYEFSVEKVKFNLFDKSLSIKGFVFRPTDSAMIQLKNQKLDKKSLNILSSSSIKLKGIQIIKALTTKHVVINRLIINDLLVQHIVSENSSPKNELKPKPKDMKLDSLRIPGISGFELREIDMKNLKIQIVDAKNGDLTFQNHPFNFNLSGFKLTPKGNEYFALEPVKDIFEIDKIKIDIPDEQYLFSLDKVRFDLVNNSICLEDLKLKPTVKPEKLASMYKYNTEVYDLHLQHACLFNLDLNRAEEGNGIFLDSIKIKGYDLKILKDKTKPFNTSKRPGLPHNKLKKMSLPIRIPKVEVTEGSLHYEEKLHENDINMQVRMKDFYLLAENITSVQKYRQQPLKIRLNAEFMDKSLMAVHLVLPLRDDQDVFRFYGSLSPAGFKYYDDAIVPALGMKVLNGTMDGLKFEAQGNSYSSEGTMILTYSELEAEVFRLKSHEKSGFLSWSINQIVHRSNPKNNGKLRVAIMEFDRVLYKGMGNYLWKTLQSGIVNTIAPFGMTVEKVEHKKRKELKKEQRRERRKSKP